jgi:type IV secretory pathway VirB6-like protein
MEFVGALWDLAVHLDQHLAAFVAEHGAWVYALLFAIVFCETGLVVTPFLPGDSLLFVVGAIAAAGDMNIFAVMATLIAAALAYGSSDAGSTRSIYSARTTSTSATAARRSSSRASCRSSAPTSRSWPASARCPT